MISNPAMFPLPAAPNQDPSKWGNVVPGITHIAAQAPSDWKDRLKEVVVSGARDVQSAITARITPVQRHPKVIVKGNDVVSTDAATTAQSLVSNRQQFLLIGLLVLGILGVFLFKRFR